MTSTAAFEVVEEAWTASLAAAAVVLRVRVDLRAVVGAGVASADVVSTAPSGVIFVVVSGLLSAASTVEALRVERLGGIAMFRFKLSTRSLKVLMGEKMSGGAPFITRRASGGRCFGPAFAPRH